MHGSRDAPAVSRPARWATPLAPLLLLALALSGAWGALGSASRALRPAGSPERDPIALLAGRLAPVTERVASGETIGFLQPAGRAAGDRAALRGMVRYVLAPRPVVDGAADARWILTHLDDDALDAVLAEPGTALVVSLRNDMTLLERRRP